MIERRAGKIIIIAGVGGKMRFATEFLGPSSTKTAVVRFAESLSRNCWTTIFSNQCLAPGETYTHMTDQILAAGDRSGWREQDDGAAESG